jgi:hypothetical protein
MAQDQDLHILGGSAAGEQPEPAEHGNEIRYSSRNSMVSDHGVITGTEDTPGHRAGDGFWHGTRRQIGSCPLTTGSVWVSLNVFSRAVMFRLATGEHPELLGMSEDIVRHAHAHAPHLPCSFGLRRVSAR